MRPYAYLVQQRGLSDYDEVCRTKAEAIQAAKECLWWSRQVTIRPIYAGKPMPWISKAESRRRARQAKS